VNGLKQSKKDKKLLENKIGEPNGIFKNRVMYRSNIIFNLVICISKNAGIIKEKNYEN
jgi:hypothetical protein